jgi:hypothetical protein
MDQQEMLWSLSAVVPFLFIRLLDIIPWRLSLSIVGGACPSQPALTAWKILDRAHSSFRLGGRADPRHMHSLRSCIQKAGDGYWLVGHDAHKGGDTAQFGSTNQVFAVARLEGPMLSIKREGVLGLISHHFDEARIRVPHETSKYRLTCL